MVILEAMAVDSAFRLIAVLLRDWGPPKGGRCEDLRI